MQNLIKKHKNKSYNFLRWTEKWTKTDMVYLAKGGFWLTFKQIAVSFSSFLLAIAFANLLPKETYGTYKYILSIVGILSITTLAGMNTAVIQAVARGFEGSFISSIKKRITWGVTGSIASLVLSIYYLANENPTLSIAFLITSIFIPFNETLGSFSSYLEGKKLFKRSSQFNTTIQLFYTLIMIIVLFISNNLFLILSTFFASQTLLKFFFFKKTVKEFKPNEKEDAKTINYGKHLSFIGVLSAVINNLDNLLLWHFLGAPSIAIYTFATAPVSQIRSFINPVFALAFPKLAKRDSNQIKKTITPKIIKLTLIIIPITLFYIISAPFLFKIFFPQYTEAVIYSQVFALILLLKPKDIISTVITAKAQKEKIYITSTVLPIAKVLLMVTLIPIYGILGMILSMIGTQLIGTFLLFYLLKKI